MQYWNTTKNEGYQHSCLYFDVHQFTAYKSQLTENAMEINDHLMSTRLCEMPLVKYLVVAVFLHWFIHVILDFISMHISSLHIKLNDTTTL